MMRLRQLWGFLLLLGAACPAFGMSVHVGPFEDVYGLHNLMSLTAGTDRAMVIESISGGYYSSGSRSSYAVYDRIRNYFFSGPNNLSSIRGGGMCLMGVFLDDGFPAAKPATLVFNTRELLEFNELRPEIGQVFFIGDGRVGYNDLSAYDSTAETPRQIFHVPDNATRVAFGFTDIHYADNAGYGLDVTPEIFQYAQPIPAPIASVAALAMLGVLGARRRSRKRGVSTSY